MTSRPRFVAGVFIFTSVAVIAATVSMYLFGDRVSQARAREESRREFVSNLHRLISTMKDAEAGQRGYLLTGDETYLRPFDEAARSLADVRGKIEEAQSLGLNRELKQTIVKLVQEKMTDLRDAIELRRSGDHVAAGTVVKSGRGKQLMEDLQKTVADLEAEQTRQLEDDVKLADESIRTRTLIFLLAACGNILFLGWAYHRISQAIEEREATAIMHRPLE
jgi:CHASE3 domain sensor protein